MAKNIEKIFYYKLLLLPLALVSGPFLPDLIISFSSILFIFYLWKIKKLNFFRNDLFIIIFIFYIYISINSLFSQEVLISLKNSFFYIRFLIFAFLLKYLIINNKNFLKYFIISILLTLTLVSVDAIIEHIIGFHWLFDKSEYGEYVVNYRISGLFDEEFILGGFLLTLFPTAIIMFDYYYNKNSNYKYIIIFLIGIFTYGIIISGERTTLAKYFLLITILLFSLDYIYTIKKKIIIFFSIIVIVITIITYQPKLHERFIQNTFNLIFQTNIDIYDLNNFFNKDKLKKMDITFFSKEHRDHAVISLNMFFDKKLFGHGLKSFRYACSNQKYYINDRACSTHAHNIFLSFLSEIGIFGIIFLLFLYSVILKSYLIARNNIQKVILISIGIYLIPFLPSGYFFNNYFSMILYILLGIYLGITKLKIIKN